MTIEERINEALAERDNLELRNEAIVYASERLKYSNRKLADLTELAIGTIRIYIKKFIHLLEKAIERFESVILDITKCPTTYIMEFFTDRAKNRFICLKVGKTDYLDKRENQLISEYKKKYNLDNIYVEVKKVFLFEDSDDALTFENELRKFYKKKKNARFIPNDRFEGVRYNQEEIENNVRLNEMLKMLSAK